MEGTAEALCETSPVLIVSNQCAIVSGSTLLNAFDRLEVLDYSAKAVIAARDIGPLVMISPKEIDDIEVAFKLK